MIASQRRVSSALVFTCSVVRSWTRSKAEVYPVQDQRVRSATLWCDRIEIVIVLPNSTAPKTPRFSVSRFHFIPG